MLIISGCFFFWNYSFILFKTRKRISHLYNRIVLLIDFVVLFKESNVVFLLFHLYTDLWNIVIRSADIDILGVAWAQTGVNQSWSAPGQWLSMGSGIYQSSVWNKKAATKASCLQLNSRREMDPPEEPNFDPFECHPALSIVVASHGMLELLITNEVRTGLGELTDSMSQNSGVI